MSSASAAALPDRFVRCPAGLDSRLIATSRASDATASRHLPEPSPRPSCGAPQARPVPDSSCAASTVQELPAGSVRSTGEPGDRPASSTPVTVASASSVAGFTSRSRLIWSTLLPGLKNGTVSASSSRGATAFMPVTNPSVVRMYASASMSSVPDSMASRQPPVPMPVAPVRPLSTLPDSRSVVLKCAACRGSRASVSGSYATRPRRRLR